jgi:hypothetical protein
MPQSAADVTEPLIQQRMNLLAYGQPLSQRYTRLTNNSYRYESNTGFTAEIVVDDLGLVTN